jgi:GTP-binding protein HflX
MLEVSDTCTVLISDTVGFIRKLPHHLVDAFKATLEELTFANLLLHVIDGSNPSGGNRPRLWKIWSGN